MHTLQNKKHAWLYENDTCKKIILKNKNSSLYQ